MRTIMKLMAVCLSCILLGNANVQAVEKTLQVEEIAKHPYIGYITDYIDPHYGYVSYAWKDGNYIRHTLKDDRFHSEKIPLKGKAKIYAKKHDAGCEWTDAKGNFYFLSENSGKKYIGTLNKVDKKGKLVKRINLNKWLKVTQESNCHYSLFIERVENREIIAEYEDYQKGGYVIFDRNSGKVKKQIVYSKSDRPAGTIACYQKTMLFGYTDEGKLIYGKIPSGKKITLSSGNKIKYQKVKKFKIDDPLPKEENRDGESFAVYKNQVYLLTSAGYYQINTENLSLKKLAAVEGIPFWKTESKNPVTIKLMLYSPKKFIINQGYLRPDVYTRKTFWYGAIS